MELRLTNFLSKNLTNKVLSNKQDTMISNGKKIITLLSF